MSESISTASRARPWASSMVEASSSTATSDLPSDSIAVASWLCQYIRTSGSVVLVAVGTPGSSRSPLRRRSCSSTASQVVLRSSAACADPRTRLSSPTASDTRPRSSRAAAATTWIHGDVASRRDRASPRALSSRLASPALTMAIPMSATMLSWTAGSALAQA